MRILLFGATGTAGSGVLRACLTHPAVTDVRVVARRPTAAQDPRLRVFLHENYLDYAGVEEAFRGVDACLWCLGISVQQVSGEDQYRRITHDFAVAAARALKAQSPDAVLHFLSGEGANPASRFMWARVKAETERDLGLIVQTVCWRPAFIDGGASQRGPLLYRVLQPMFRAFSFIRSIYVASEDIGWAMLHAVRTDVREGVIANARIRELADRERIARGARSAAAL